MSKYLRDGKPVPYHFIEYVDKTTTYHKHVEDLWVRVSDLVCEIPAPKGDDATHVHEVGCGEGLIVLKLAEHLDGMGICVSGNDADPVAVDMAGELLGGLVSVTLEAEQWRREDRPHVVLFCDSLEHMKTWREHLEWAKETAELVVIAVPSQPDRHADNVFGADSFDGIFKGWEIAHRATRHARHLSIYRRAP